jgi:hypothetical protein
MRPEPETLQKLARALELDESLFHAAKLCLVACLQVA